MSLGTVPLSLDISTVAERSSAVGLGTGDGVESKIGELEQAAMANGAIRITIMESVRIFTLMSLAELFDLLDDFFCLNLMSVVQSNALPRDLTVRVDKENRG